MLSELSSEACGFPVPRLGFLDSLAVSLQSCRFVSEDMFTKRFAVSHEREDEKEIMIPFEFLSKAEMAAEPYSMSTSLGPMYSHRILATHYDILMAPAQHQASLYTRKVSLFNNHSCKYLYFACACWDFWGLLLIGALFGTEVVLKICLVETVSCFVFCSSKGGHPGQGEVCRDEPCQVHEAQIFHGMCYETNTQLVSEGGTHCMRGSAPTTANSKSVGTQSGST